MEEVCGLIPMNPHAPQVIAQQVEQRVPRQKTERVRDPVRLVRRVIIIGFVPFAQFSDRLGPLIVCPRPHPKGNSIERMRGVLLQDKCVVNAVWLRASGTNLDIVGKACLSGNRI